MDLEKRIEAFISLGSYIKLLVDNDMQALPIEELEAITSSPDELIKLQEKLLNYYQFSIHHNAWFTQEFILFALKDWTKALQKEKIEEWLNPYSIQNDLSVKTVGIVMAGNLPLVGFHDYLTVLLSGHKLLAKLSSDDAVLLPILHEILSLFEPKMADRALFTQGTLKGFDAIIATGSDNTSRYFEYYFGKYPNIIRKNRSGIAVLTGNETDEELKSLSTDIMAYFGLGCRSVSKLFIPKNYELKRLFEVLESYNHLSNHHKFFNNYEYNKAIYLVNSEMHRDTGFLLFKEDMAMSSPISVIYYEEYSDKENLQNIIDSRKNEIQCIIGKGYIPFGQSQHPNLNDYADGVDTMAFLLRL